MQIKPAKYEIRWLASPRCPEVFPSQFCDLDMFSTVFVDDTRESYLAERISGFLDIIFGKGSSSAFDSQDPSQK